MTVLYSGLSRVFWLIIKSSSTYNPTHTLNIILENISIVAGSVYSGLIRMSNMQ